MKVVTGRHGQTIVSSKSFQLYDKINLADGIYECDLSPNENHLANQLHITGILTRVKDNGQIKYKVFEKD